MVDIHPDQCAAREKVFATIRSVFRRHGAVEIETPVCELKETLMGKYGEDTKLVYDLQDQGGELLSLRYDLTVPFARYLAEHGVDKIRRFHIGRVYRRDNPQLSRGRFREFYQCDFDAAGTYDDMIPDSECVKIVSEILTEVGLEDYLVKINHRDLLDGVFGLCGVPERLFRAICSAVDKLDKEQWPEVRQEMVAKGVSESVADALGNFVTGPQSKSLAQLRVLCEKQPGPEEHRARCMRGLDSLAKLFGYVDAFKVPASKVTFDMSMARGLDYYTGVIFEVVLTGGGQVGSISGGGRYDNLVGMFDKKGRSVPCVGISVGIERLFTVVEQRAKADKAAKTSATQVLAAAVPFKEGDSLACRMELCAELWARGVRAEFVHKTNPKLVAQFQHCEKERIPVLVYVGPDELKAGQVKVRKYVFAAEDGTSTHVETVVPRDALVDHVVSLLL